MADRGSSLSIRWRATLGAVAVVGAALALAGVAMILLLRDSMTDNVRSTTLLQANAVADLFSSGALESVGSTSDDELVQIVGPQGEVVTATDNVNEEAPVAVLSPGESERIDVAFDDDPFMVAAAATQDGEHVVLVGRSLDQVVESVAAVTAFLVVGFPLLLLVVGGVTWAVVGRSLAPVERIRAEVDEISTGELHRRVPESGARDEIGRLAATMNRMLQRLQAGHERQRRFVSDASHELRSPVSTIRQHAEIAVAHPDGTTADELAKVVLEEDLRLQRLVEDLLLLAQIDEGAARPSREQLDLDDLVLAEAKRLRQLGPIEIDASKVSAGRVLGDRKLLSRLVVNLLDNAVRHARTRVAIALGPNRSGVSLVVEDDGPGVPESERERIFERFVRVEEARDRSSGGAGLGLSIVAEVAAAHGGDVGLAESALGGSRFEVWLPAAGDSGSFS